MSENIDNRDLELEAKEKALADAKLKFDMLKRSDFYGVIRETKEYSDLINEVNRCNRIVDFHRLWKKFAPIKEQIESLKKEIGFIDSDDRFTYNIKQNGDITILSFNFNHYDNNYPKYSEGEYCYRYDILSGYIAYDSTGHVYLLHKHKCDMPGMITGREMGIYTSHVTYDCYFIDNEYMYTNNNNSTDLYGLVDGKYILIHSFGGHDTISIDPALWKNKLLIINKTQLFSVENNKFISDVNRGQVQSCESNYIGEFLNVDKDNKELTNQQQALVSKYLKDNNLIMVYKTNAIMIGDQAQRRYRTVYYMDMSGHIVSKIYFISEDTGKVSAFDINEDTFDEDMNTIIRLLYNEILEELKVKEENAKGFYETMKSYCQTPVDPMKKTYHPNDKKQKEEKQD